MEPLSLSLSLVRSLSGDNSLAPFHFWWRETVLKSEKVYKWLRLYNWSNCSNSIISTQQTFACSKSTIEEGINMLKTPEQRSRRSSGVFDFVVNFEHTLHLFLVFLLLTLNKEIFAWIQSWTHNREAKLQQLCKKDQLHFVSYRFIFKSKNSLFYLCFRVKWYSS